MTRSDIKLSTWLFILEKSIEFFIRLEQNWIMKWTYEICRKEAKKYKTRTAFRNGSSGAYDAARKNGWHDDVCKHMQPAIYWDYKRVKKEARIPL